MATLNEVVRRHELTAEGGYQGVCAQFWPLWHAIAKQYFPGLPICYFRCEPLPIKMLVRINGVNGVGARHDFTLISRRLGSSKLVVPGSMLHCQIHICGETVVRDRAK